MANSRAKGFSTSLYIATRHKPTWTRLIQRIQPTDRSHWIMVAIQERLDREDGQTVDQETLRQTLREELSQALRGLSKPTIQQPPVDSDYDNLAEQILGGIDF